MNRMNTSLLCRITNGQQSHQHVRAIHSTPYSVPRVRHKFAWLSQFTSPPVQSTVEESSSDWPIFGMRKCTKVVEEPLPNSPQNLLGR